MDNERRFRFVVIAVTSFASFMTAFMGSAINVALPLIGKQFNTSAVLLSWLATAYLLTAAVLLVPVGKLSDIYGRTKLMKIGILVFAASSVVCGASTTDIMLLVSRLFQGAGSSMIFSTSTAILVSAFPPKERGKILGINVTSVYIGLSSGPFLGGLITHYFDWRFIFYISSVIGIFVLLMAEIYIKVEWKEAEEEKFDTSGSIVYISALVMVMLGLTFLPLISGIALLVIGLAAMYMFFRFEERKISPVFNVKIFISNKTFTLSNLSALINYSATFAVGFLMSLYLQNVLSLSPQDAGLILVTQPLMMAIFSPFAGRLSDKIEPQIVASSGMAILTVCLVVFTFLSPGFGLVTIILNLSLLGFGFALFSSPNVNAIMGSVEKKYYGVASSTLASMRMIGQMFSMGIVIVIFSLLIGKADIIQQNPSGFMMSVKIAFILFSVLSFIGIFTSLSRGKIHK